MELRHLRNFVAVADAGSLTVAAEKKLHTAQPSLSRQIRDLEYEVGVTPCDIAINVREPWITTTPSLDCAQRSNR
jgi:hypothetical protein